MKVPFSSHWNLVLIWIVLVLGTTGTTEAQSDVSDSSQPQFVQITLNDGTLKIGRLIAINEQEVVIDISGLGDTSIPKYLIQELLDVQLNEKELSQGFINASNQPSRYFFAPSGFQLAEGEGYFQSNVALNSISYGFSDRFTGGFMVSVMGAGVTAKYGGQVGENIHMSIGGLASVDYYGILDRPLVLGFANVTFGDEDKHLTLNLGLVNKFDDGYYYSNIELDSTFIASTWSPPGYWQRQYRATRRHDVWQNPLLISLSAMLPLTPNRWLITENHLVVPSLRRDEVSILSPPYYSSYPISTTSSPWRSSGGGISLGVRSYNKNTGWLWDYGLAGIIGDGFGFPVPWFSFTLEF